MVAPVRVCYALLSPTWGMHQYTADLASRMAAAGHDVHVVMTRHAPADRYGPEVTIHQPVATTDRGFSRQGLAFWQAHNVLSSIFGLRPNLVHFTGPHLWNPLLLSALRRTGIPTIQTIHDLHPHAGSSYGRLLYLWNGWVRRTAGHILVHGERFRQQLLEEGTVPERITQTPLTHLFLSHARERSLRESPPPIRYEPWALFIGRLEAYKGIDILVQAAVQLGAGITIAGQGELVNLIRRPIPLNVTLRNELVADEDAIDLVRRCGVLVLPYIEASQSALVAAAYFFQKPVIGTRVGALPEYIIEGETGWVIPPGDPHALAVSLKSALADPAELERMGRAGRAWYDQHRQGETEILLDMYATVAARRCG
jgi:glycosyltransferase involved in cell wall biosynthesis